MAGPQVPPTGVVASVRAFLRAYGEVETLAALFTGTSAAFAFATKLVPPEWSAQQAWFGSFAVFFGVWCGALLMFRALHACGRLVCWVQRQLWPSALRIEVHGGERATLTVHVEAGPPTATFRATAQLVGGDGRTLGAMHDADWTDVTGRERVIRTGDFGTLRLAERNWVYAGIRLVIGDTTFEPKTISGHYLSDGTRYELEAKTLRVVIHGDTLKRPLTHDVSISWSDHRGFTSHCT